MPTRYELYLCRDTGERLVLLSEYFELQYQIVQQEAGFCHVVLPATFDPSYIRPDYKIAIWRQPDGGSMALEDVYLIRYYRKFTNSDGARRFEVVGANGNSILVDRMPLTSVADTYYFCGRSVTGAADDVMKDIVKYGLQRVTTGATDNILPAYFSIEAKTTQGQSFTKAIKYRTLADECSARGATSRGRGTDILWHVVALSETEYQFRTYVNQIGQNRTWPDGYNPILVSEENGTMAEPEYVWDGVEAKNEIKALGANQTTTISGVSHTYRNVATARDKLMGAYNTTSEYSHRQAFIDCGFDPPDGYQLDEALAELDNSYPKEVFSFRLQDTEDQKYGRDWKFGDKITAFYADKYYTCRIRGVTVEKSSADQPESIAIDMDIISATAPETA